MSGPAGRGRRALALSLDDLLVDPDEMVNLAGQPAITLIRRTLAKQLAQLRISVPSH